MADYVRGTKLRKLRELRHESQEFVAAELQVSAKSLRAWEHGGKIRWDNAKRLAAYYGVDPETLVTRETSEPETEQALPLPSGPADVSELAALFSELAEQVRLFQLETATRDLEVLRLLEERLPPKGQSQAEQLP